MARLRVSERSKDGGNYGHIYVDDFIGYILKPRVNGGNNRPLYKYYVPVLHEKCDVALYHFMFEPSVKLHCLCS